MEFIVPKDFLSQRCNSIPRIKTWQEKEALLVEDNKSVYDFIKPLLPKGLIPINELEADAFILNIREKSISDEFSFISTCQECQTMNEYKPSVSKFLNLNYNETKTEVRLSTGIVTLPQGLFTKPESIINTNDLENLSIKEYNLIEKALFEQNDKILKYTYIGHCRKCGTGALLEITPRENFSVSSLSGLYKDYIEISSFTSNSKLDIDDLYPFEREIYNSLLEEKTKEQPT